MQNTDMNVSYECECTFAPMKPYNHKLHKINHSILFPYGFTFYLLYFMFFTAFAYNICKFELQLASMFSPFTTVWQTGKLQVLEIFKINSGLGLQLKIINYNIL